MIMNIKIPAADKQNLLTPFDFMVKYVPSWFPATGCRWAAA